MDLQQKKKTSSQAENKILKSSQNNTCTNYTDCIVNSLVGLHVDICVKMNIT